MTDPREPPDGTTWPADWELFGPDQPHEEEPRKGTPLILFLGLDLSEDAYCRECGQLDDFCICRGDGPEYDLFYGSIDD